MTEASCSPDPTTNSEPMLRILNFHEFFNQFDFIGCVMNMTEAWFLFCSPDLILRIPKPWILNCFQDFFSFILLTRSIHQFRNYESWIFTIFLTISILFVMMNMTEVWLVIIILFTGSNEEFQNYESWIDFMIYLVFFVKYSCDYYYRVHRIQ